MAIFRKWFPKFEPNEECCCTSSIQSYSAHASQSSSPILPSLETKGLDDSGATDASLFVRNGFDGQRIKMLSHWDMESIGISKLGHQELILESVDLLCLLRFSLDTTNLQSVSLKLLCHTRNLSAEIRHMDVEKKSTHGVMPSNNPHSASYLSNTVLSCVVEVIAGLKTFVSWLDRSPFDSMYDMCQIRNSVVRIGFSLASITSCECDFGNIEETISKLCSSLIAICESFLHDSHDPLIIMPAFLEQATIRHSQEDGLGIKIQSSYNGVHIIDSIEHLSPAYLCSRIEIGDEVVQVNGQMVIGWQQQHLFSILRSSRKETTLLLKKRPRHFHPMAAVHGHRRQDVRHTQASTLPKSMKKRRPRVSGGNQSSPDDPVLYGPRGEKEEVYFIKVTLSDSEGDADDTDVEVFTSNVASPHLNLPVSVDVKQRRATVAGGSPTLELSLCGNDVEGTARPIPVTGCSSITSGGGELCPVMPDISSEGSPRQADLCHLVEDGAVSSSVHTESLMPVHCGHSDNVVIKDIPQPMFVTSLDSSLVPDNASCLQSSARHGGSHGTHLRLDRRVACDDLGKVDHEGALYKRKESDSMLGKLWCKRWCVLKGCYFFYYKHKTDIKAKGVIFLPVFEVSRSPHLKTRKFAFQIHNGETNFYFASDSDDDADKWLSKLRHAAVSVVDSVGDNHGGAVSAETQSHLLHTSNVCHGESEEDLNDDKSPVSQSIAM